MPSVDLNSDLAEGFGIWHLTEDEALMDIVSSANIACGLHAGDPEIMAKAFAYAKSRGVAVGAHPGFPDLWGFGRRRMPFTPGEIERLVAYQVGAAQALATYSGHRITYVKVHGALGNIAEQEPEVAVAVANAVKAVDPSLVVLAGPLGAQAPATRDAGLRLAAEIFADRGYTEQGHLIPRSQPGAMIHDPVAAADRIIAMVQSGAVITAQGTHLPTSIDSICVHGDGPKAVETARYVRERLEAAGIAIAPFAP
ncbi:lactam utilization protein [Azorhizobium caulinodans ORS 571]|uniref:5-oxoprolinase subunit A n=1 Tax=Azorhizobium caulinodans (strain ATCC 43989 / DSM 5975 / JCM 20966 / LMG 6465 / NBRC 14845 / NCIMB 13405 / ORS 571) TaxID=438753 RepID=PXPA_AZOC5|nr:5-oxoprolinase subunit PxpA [Azorhizobium caulinodans]A8HRP6.1 RecName: Full=5-oxoprolinase subunit A; Short=5-OPase subunit A; AltName: Full=5-oxoprolinase (ATP-hydrolyzing) subunit A [Azorhizobium caulinodans ORS 571]BAF90072.1 lactam utilization protein [Azorhizobium caulinodans ORS 571]